MERNYEGELAVLLGDDVGVAIVCLQRVYGLTK